MKNIVLQGDLGRIISARVENGSFLPDWHPYENYQTNYAARTDLGGGAVLTCIHEIDYANYLFNKPLNIICKGGKKSKLRIDVEDFAKLKINYQIKN